MLEFLEDETHWPKLRYYECDFADRLYTIRPFVFADSKLDYHRKDDKPERFVREWLCLG